MLFKTTTEIKLYLSVNISTEFASIKPDIKWAEEEYIKRYLGTELYTELLDAYNAATTEAPLSEAHQELLEKVQLPLIYLAYGSYINVNQVQISDAGVHIHSTDKKKTAFQWQINELIKDFNRKGFDGLERLLEYLEENKATFTAWASSDAYTLFKTYFINSAKEFHEYYGINKSRLTYLSLVPIMKTVEDFHLMPALGVDFFDEIKAEIATGSLSADTTKIMRYIRPAVAYLTIAEACTELSVEFINNGFIVNQYTGAQAANTKTTPADNLISAKMRSARTKGEVYLKDLVDYLNANASATKYATYFASSNYVSPEDEEEDGDASVYNNDDEDSKIYFGG